VDASAADKPTTSEEHGILSVMGVCCYRDAPYRQGASR